LRNNPVCPAPHTGVENTKGIVSVPIIDVPQLVPGNNSNRACIAFSR
jgi:hypothetical protein